MKLESNPNKTPQQAQELAEKKAKLKELEARLKELERLLEQDKENSSVDNKDKSGKVALIVGCGIVGVVLIGFVFILVRGKKKRKKLNK